LLLTTFEAAEGAPHLAHAELSELIGRCHELTKTLAAAVEKAGGHLPSTEASTSGQRFLRAWPTASGAISDKDTPPAMALASASDVLVATPESQVLYAGKHVDIAADGALHLASGEHAHVSAGQGVTVHACDGGIDLRAANGPVRIEASQNDMHLDARQAITVTSHDDEIILSGRIIRLVGGDGSYIRLGEGIQIGSPEECHMDVKNVRYAPSRSLDRARKQTPTEGARQRARLRFDDIDPTAAPAAAGWSYAVHRDGNEAHWGKTDKDGLADWIDTDTIATARIDAMDEAKDGSGDDA
jgi:type VI secretion system secreted protein VgrG